MLTRVQGGDEGGILQETVGSVIDSVILRTRLAVMRGGTGKGKRRTNGRGAEDNRSMVMRIVRRDVLGGQSETFSRFGW